MAPFQRKRHALEKCHDQEPVYHRPCTARSQAPERSLESEAQAPRLPLRSGQEHNTHRIAPTVTRGNIDLYDLRSFFSRISAP